MPIAREEIFGPVVAIIPFDAEAEARRASPTRRRTGFRALVWTRDIGKALRTAKAVRSGVVSVNCNSASTWRRRSAATGSRASGASSGSRALDLYTETKNVFVDLS